MNFNFVRKFSEKNITEEDYKKYISFINWQINKNNWPTFISEGIFSDKWTEESISNFAYNFFCNSLEQNTCKYQELSYNDLPLKLNHYVTNIMEKQKVKFVGVFCCNFKKTIRDIVKSNRAFFKKIEVNGDDYWVYNGYENNEILQPKQLEELLNELAKIDISEQEKKEKFNIRQFLELKIKEVLILTKSPVEEDFLIDFLYNLLSEILVEIGTLWRVKNKTWAQHTQFARQNPTGECHPGLVIDETGLSEYTIAPGTSLPQKGNFVIELKNRTHFLFHYSINGNWKNFYFSKYGYSVKEDLYITKLTKDDLEKLKKAVVEWKNKK